LFNWLATGLFNPIKSGKWQKSRVILFSQLNYFFAVGLKGKAATCEGDNNSAGEVSCRALRNSRIDMHRRIRGPLTIKYGCIISLKVKLLNDSVMERER
jgi:hypothetical protein